MAQKMMQPDSLLKERAHELFRTVKDAAREADGIEIMLTTSLSENLRFGNNELGQSQFGKSRNLSIRLTTGERQARATTGRLEKSLVEKTAQKALSQARTAPQDPDHLPMLEPQHYRKVDRYHERTLTESAEQKAAHIGFAIDLARKNSLLASGVLGTSVDNVWILNSAGLEANYKGTDGFYSLTMDADNGNQTGYALSTFADIRELNAGKVAETALDRARLNKNQGEVSPGKYDVVIDPYAWSETLLYLSVSASAGFAPDFGMRQYKEGRSYLSGRLGEKIMGENINIEDDAYHSLQTGPNFDGEGYPKSSISLVENGVLQGLASSRISAHRYADAKPTGHELQLPNPLGETPTNLVIRAKGSVKTPEKLVGELDKGILITRLWYVREVEPRTKTLTGMTRDGTFLVENGEVKKPLRNLRFNQSLLELFNNIDAVSEPIRNVAEFGGATILQPGVLARGFNFTSVSVF